MDILVFKALITSEREVVHETLDNEELNFHGWLSRNVSKLYLRLPNGLKCKIIEIKEGDLIISFNTRGDVKAVKLSELILSNRNWLMSNLNKFTVTCSLI